MQVPPPPPSLRRNREFKVSVVISFGRAPNSCVLSIEAESAIDAIRQAAERAADAMEILQLPVESVKFEILK